MQSLQPRARFRMPAFLRTTATLLMATATFASSAAAQRVAEPRFVLPRATSLSGTATGLSSFRLAEPRVPQQIIGLQENGWGAGLGIEPFVGRLQFDKDMRQADQDVAGVRAGAYLGASMRVRGYWWRGADTIGTSDSKMQSYGGELEMGIQDGWFIHPFVLLGGGRLDYADDYRSMDSLSREDQNVWILGGGLKLRALEWLEFNVAFRDNLLRPPRVRDRWVNNTMWTAGMSLRVGGTPSKTTMYSTTSGAAGAGAGGASGAAAAGAAGASGNVATFPVPVGGGEIKVVYNGDTLRLRDSALVARSLVTGTATVDAIRDLVSSELAYLNALFPVPFGTTRGALTTEQADSLTRRLGLRTNGVYDYLVRGQAESMRAAMQSELTARGVDAASRARILARMDSALSERVALNDAQSRAIMMRNDSAYARRAREEAEADKRTVTAGIGGFSEFYLDSRVNFRSPWLKELRIGPQVALGFFGGAVSALVTGNGLYYWSAGKTKPYAGLGMGLLVRSGEIGGETGTSFVVNPTFGVEFTNASARRFGERALGYFAELQGVDFFGNTRLVGGVTWKF